MIIRKLNRSDDHEVLARILHASGARIYTNAGIRSYRTVLHHALMDRRAGPQMVIAVHEGEIVGYVLCLINRPAYMKYLSLSHPVIIMHYIMAVLRSHLRHLLLTKGGMSYEAHPVKSGTDYAMRAWREESPVIAKVQYVYVCDSARGRNVACQMYHEMIKELRNRSVIRLDAMVGNDNAPSIALHSRVFKNSYVHDSNTVFTLYL